MTPTLDGDVLAVLARADSAFTGRGLHQVLGQRSESGVRRALGRLVSQGIVTATDVGGSRSYRLNERHLAAPYIRAIANLPDEFHSRLRNRFESWEVPVVYAALFGSAARREMRADSDIDLLIVRPDHVAAEEPRWASQIDELVRDATAWTGNDVRVLEMPEAHVAAGLASGEQVLVDIREQGVTVIGRQRILRRGPGEGAGR